MQKQSTCGNVRINQVKEIPENVFHSFGYTGSCSVGETFHNSSTDFFSLKLTAGFNLLSAKSIAVDYTLEETKPLAKQRAQYRRAISSG